MNIPNTMQPIPQTLSMTVGDIYYTLFRHKWKIILCALTGLAAAAAFYVLRPPPFQSEARLFIRYVMESQGVGPTGNDIRMMSTDRGGETVINTEIEILTSLDLAEQVAKAIGPEKILGYNAGADTLRYAAALIRGKLQVEVPARSSVLHVVFSHPNPEITQLVLTEIIDQYLKRHVEIHRASGSGFLASETDQLRSRLAQTEEELRSARNKAGVNNLDDAKKSYAEQISRLRMEISSAQAELAERSSVLLQLTKEPLRPLPADGQAPAEAGTEPTTEQIKQYRSLLERQELLLKKEQELLISFTEDSTRVKDVHAQLNGVESLKKTLEDNFPRLSLINSALSTQVHTPEGQIDLATETARLNALQVKIKVLSAQLEAIRAEAAKTDQMEVTILQLMRQKELEEANYRKYAASLEQTRINDAIGMGGVSNISQIQSPSPPFSDRKKVNKIIGVLAATGVAAGLAWAFFIELYFDRSVKRPIDIERLVRLPLFLSIPRLTKKELHLGAANKHLSLPAPATTTTANSQLSTKTSTSLSPWEGEHPLHPFHETLRDRLISYFESKGLTHKPKLVAVTGLGRNSGVTTIAAGLASTLSKTGDGNVLLVDMTQGQGSAQQFYEGKAVCGLEEILDARDSAQIENNFFVVGQEPGGEKLSRILPHRFNKLVPRLKASNFDYIIFDMPAVSQISITPRLASFMDMVLFVIESEKTDRDLLQRATSLLSESNSHVGVVLNKTKTYVPRKLYQDNLGNT
jgi:uncharacterized protein involved in exopolysaccharide biosynthesis/Mrp family chromosome partitioning ATPase